MLDASHRLDVQRAMTRGSGPVRSAASTAGALEALATLAARPPSTAEPGPATWETTNLLHLGQALSTVAHRREETRGGHVRSDFPERDDARWLTHLTTTRPADGALVVTERPVEVPGMSDFGFPTADALLLVERALDEDLSTGTDVTTMATIPASQVSVSHLVARADGVVAGLPVVALVLDAVAARLGSGAVGVELLVEDGIRVVRGDHLATLRGADAHHLGGRADRPQHPVAHLGGGDAHPALGRRARGVGRDGARHPQDDAGDASTREVRGALRRGHQQADGPVRRRDDQGQPQAGRRGADGGVRRGAADLPRRARSRSR